MTTVTLEGWSRAPELGVLVPEELSAGWIDAAFWCVLLEAWGFPARTVSPHEVASARCSTLIVPVASIDAALREALLAADASTLLLVGSADDVPGAEAAHRFPETASTLEPRRTEGVVDRAYEALLDATPHGVVGLWRWPGGADAALVVDGDVDHPTGVAPECARYVAPAIETMRRAGFPAYGIFAAAANVKAEPESFPLGADYYNHSFSHPYSHWNPMPWASLDDSAMIEEIEAANDVLEDCLGQNDHRMFRLPHFQLEAADRTYGALDRLEFLAESSVGANHAVTGGLPYHPALEPWSARMEDAAYARSHPDPSRRRRLLQIPISTDPTDGDFPNGCCSYNTLSEGVRDRTADPEAYEGVLEAALETAVRRGELAHLFIDPPDAGYGRLLGDAPDYAGAVERWLTRAVARSDLAIMTTAELTGWWRAREQAVDHMGIRLEDETLVVDVPEPPAGAALMVRAPGGERTIVPVVAP